MSTDKINIEERKETQKEVRLDYIVNMAKDGHFKESVLMINDDMSVVRILLGQSVDSVMIDRESFIEIAYNTIEDMLEGKILKKVDKEELITKLVKKVALWRG